MIKHILKPLCLSSKLGSTTHQLCEFLNLCLSVSSSLQWRWQQALPHRGSQRTKCVNINICNMLISIPGILVLFKHLPYYII